jgi:N-acetylglucosaminyldiphosphoundecaprenol N-acetyl-beta-D-mannosaminyltransferase
MSSSGHTCRRPSQGPVVNGVRIDPVSPGDLLEITGSFLECARSHTVHFCAAHPTVEARRDPAYREVLNAGDLNVPDGAPVAWAARLQGVPARRQPGTDSLHLVVGWGVSRGLRHYLYGATNETLQAMRDRLASSYPGVKIVGTEAPPFGPIEELGLDETVARIRSSGADVVWVGLGAPKQDIVAARLRDRDAAPVIMCVGAAFDFAAGIKRRAPAWMRRLGLEWLHRLAAEPGRLWHRYLVGNTLFLAGVLADRPWRRRVIP